MKNKGFSILELVVVIALIGIVTFLIILNLPGFDEVSVRQEELRKAQIISVDEKGNELWRVYDEEVGRYIYYMPKAETSWKEPYGKSTRPMGVQ